MSTKFGAGFEFFPDQGPTQIKRSSDRIERLWLGAPATVLRRVGDTALFEIEGGNIRVVRAGFREALPFWLEAPDSYITLDRCSVKLGPFERQVEYGQFHADRSSDYWSEAEAVRRAADDCLIAAADINQADALNRNLFETLARFRETRVLVLGDFSTEHRPRLNRIAAELSSLGYAPLFLDEVPDVIGDYDLSRKFDILAGTAKFVVFDDSSRSGHFFELERAGVANLVTLILRLEGTHSSAMSSGRSLTSKVVREFSYREETLPAITREGADWAEKVIAGLHQERRLMHPWMSEEKTPLPGGA